MARRLPAGVHDVAQALACIRVVLSCRKAIPILANRALKISLSGNRGRRSGSNVPKQIVPRTGLDLRGCARNTCACHDCCDQERTHDALPTYQRPSKAALIIGAGRRGEHRQAGAACRTRAGRPLVSPIWGRCLTAAQPLGPAGDVAAHVPADNRSNGCPPPFSIARLSLSWL